MLIGYVWRTIVGRGSPLWVTFIIVYQLMSHLPVSQSNHHLRLKNNYQAFDLSGDDDFVASNIGDVCFSCLSNVVVVLHWSESGCIDNCRLRTAKWPRRLIRISWSRPRENDSLKSSCQLTDFRRLGECASNRWSVSLFDLMPTCQCSVNWFPI